ncbi:hypothetical protein [Persephonella sp. KM09-Lau-8]|uniref:hypothetical protein n=1 Tax=Persephonella sp. KM09-Lau-8 TaxID=1158345 RepID=UPI0004979CDF|nr:hypothetical protein [Persephonella sp. KM09-Lau-8]
MRKPFLKGLAALILSVSSFAQDNSIENYASQKCDTIGRILVKCMTYENCQDAQNELAFALSRAAGMSLEEKRTLINFCGIECRKIKSIPKNQRPAAMQGEYNAIFKKCYETELNIYRKNPEIR